MSKPNFKSKKELKILSLLDKACLFEKNNYEKKISVLYKALEKSININQKELEVKSLKLLAEVFFEINDYKGSLKFSKRALIICVKSNNPKEIAESKYLLAKSYFYLGIYDLSLPNFLDSLRFFQKENQNKDDKAIEFYLGNIYEYYEDYYSAFKYYKKAIKISKKKYEESSFVILLNAICDILIKMNKLNFATYFNTKALENKERSRNNKLYSSILFVKGKLFFHYAKFKEAERIYFKLLEEGIYLGDDYERAKLFIELSKNFLAQGEIAESLQFAFKGLSFLKSNEYCPSCLRNLYKLMSDIYQYKGDELTSLYYLGLYEKENEVFRSNRILDLNECFDKSLLKREKEDYGIGEKVFFEGRSKNEYLNMRQEFLSIMSHEIRTPLNTISSIVALLKDEKTSEQKKMLDTLSFACYNLNKIVNDVLDYNKLDAKKIKIESKPTDLKILGEQIIQIHEKFAIDKGLEIYKEIELEEKIFYQIDTIKLTQILSNLITNAIKFTTTGKVVLKIKKLEEDTKFDVILFEVIDTGEGISVKDQYKIFNRYSQLKSLLTSTYKGSGLGLSIVKRLVELFGGKIKINSEIGIGTNFNFELKLEKYSFNKEGKNEVKKKKVDLMNKRVLIVEDVQVNAFLLSKILSKWGMFSEIAPNGEEALIKIKGSSFDLIVLDIHLPNMNGFEVSKIIKTTKNPNQKTPILALTADTISIQNDSNMEYFEGTLWKPFELDALKSIIEGMID